MQTRRKKENKTVVTTMKVKVFLDDVQQGYVDEFTLGAQAGAVFMNAIIVQTNPKRLTTAVVTDIRREAGGSVEFHCYTPDSIKRKFS